MDFHPVRVKYRNEEVSTWSSELVVWRKPVFSFCEINKRFSFGFRAKQLSQWDLKCSCIGEDRRGGREAGGVNRKERKCEKSLFQEPQRESLALGLVKANRDAVGLSDILGIQRWGSSLLTILLCFYSNQKFSREKMMDAICLPFTSSTWQFLHITHKPQDIASFD